MNRINIRRLQQISLDMQDCLNDMEENITIYDNSEEKYKKFLQQSFRASLVQYKELLGNYIAHCLKEVNTSVSDMTYYSAINLCIENEYLPSEKDEFYKTLSRHRNQASHTYKKFALLMSPTTSSVAQKPPFEIIRDFYINNKSIFEDILLYINSFINKIR